MGPMHTLVLYGQPGPSSDRRLRELGRADGALTVLTLARREQTPRLACCDLRSGMWNEICRELAGGELTHARATLAGRAAELDTIEAPTGRVTDALADEARARGADAIVLAGAGLGPLERRRLRRRSSVPVSE